MVTAEEPSPLPPESPPLPYTVEQRDASVTEQWDVPSRTYRRIVHDKLAVQRPFTPAEDAWADRRAVEETRVTNRAELLGRARTALATNQAYLDAVAAGTATTADHMAQTAALTRQMQALIRLLIGADLLDTTGG